MKTDPGHAGGPLRPPMRRFKQLRFRQLRAFVELADQGSFAAAAKRLNLAVTSVWQQVRSLEVSLGVDLVHAEGKTLTLTADGQRLLGLVSPLVRGFDDLQRSFADRESDPPQRLTLAVLSASIVPDLPGLLARFQTKHTDVELLLLERDSATCIGMLVSGAADLAVVGLLDDDTLAAGLTARGLTRCPFMFVCPQNHPLAHAPRLSLAALARHAFVLPAEGGNARSRVEAVFAAAGLRRNLKVAKEAAADEPLLGHVRKGFGVTIIPMSRLAATAESAAETRGIVVRDVSRLFGYETITLLHRGLRCQAAHEKALCDLLLARGDGDAARRRAR